MDEAPPGADAGSALPGAPERFAQRQATEKVLTDAGYSAIGLDHFAKPDDGLAKAAARGNMQRNFQGYTSDSAKVLLGFGASSIGSLPQGYVQNAPKVVDYIAALRATTYRWKRASPSAPMTNCAAK